MSKYDKSCINYAFVLTRPNFSAKLSHQCLKVQNVIFVNLIKLHFFGHCFGSPYNKSFIQAVKSKKSIS